MKQDGITRARSLTLSVFYARVSSGLHAHTQRDTHATTETRARASCVVYTYDVRSEWKPHHDEKVFQEASFAFLLQKVVGFQLYYVWYIIVSSRLVSSQNSLSGKSAGAMRHQT